MWRIWKFRSNPMPNHFRKKCACHGKVVLVSKKSWHQLRRNKGSTMVCSSTVLEAGYFYMPYIPLLKMIIQ